jgi:hypothetical protein
MEYEVSARYNRSIINSAVKRFWVRSCARDTAIGVILFGIAGALWFYFDAKTWYTATFAALSVIFIFIMAAVFFVYRRRSLKTFDEMGSPIALWRFTEETFSADSGMGKAEFKWPVVKKLWRFPDVWLLFYSNQSYSTLPVAEVSAEARQFIEGKIRSHGGIVK